MEGNFLLPGRPVAPPRLSVGVGAGRPQGPGAVQPISGLPPLSHGLLPHPAVPHSAPLLHSHMALPLPSRSRNITYEVPTFLGLGRNPNPNRRTSTALCSGWAALWFITKETSGPNCG